MRPDFLPCPSVTRRALSSLDRWDRRDPLARRDLLVVRLDLRERQGRRDLLDPLERRDPLGRRGQRGPRARRDLLVGRRDRRDPQDRRDSRGRLDRWGRRD